MMVDATHVISWIGEGVSAAAVVGTLAGLVQSRTTGGAQRIAAAVAALFIDTVKLLDAVRDELAPAVVLVPTTIPPAADPDATLDPSTTEIKK